MLLILAGVSISLVVGDNGVLTQAQSASKKTDVASANSAMQLAVSTLTTEFMAEWSDNVTLTVAESKKVKDLYNVLDQNGFTLKTYNGAAANSSTDTPLETANAVIYEKGNDKTTYTFSVTVNDKSITVDSVTKADGVS